MKWSILFSPCNESTNVELRASAVTIWMPYLVTLKESLTFFPIHKIYSTCNISMSYWAFCGESTNRKLLLITWVNRLFNYQLHMKMMVIKTLVHLFNGLVCKGERLSKNQWAPLKRSATTVFHVEPAFTARFQHNQTVIFLILFQWKSYFSHQMIFHVFSKVIHFKFLYFISFFKRGYVKHIKLNH